MTFYPASALVILIWLWVSFRDPDRGVAVCIAILPFGMFAAVDAGGLSVLAAHLVAVLTIATLVLRRFAGHAPPVSLCRSGLLLIVFAVYALFSATVLIAVFTGQFLVFPLSFDRSGLAVSIHFSSTMKPLASSNSNIAQAGYILLSTVLFVVVADQIRRRGTAIVLAGAVWAATLNITLGIVDFLALDDLLAFIRTADYALANEHSFLGMPRVIGGFAEASEFGPVSAAFFGFFAVLYMAGRRSRDLWLAVGNLVLSAMSFSTTAYVALFVAVVLVVVQARRLLVGMSRTFGHLLVTAFAAVIFGGVCALILTPAADTTGDVFKNLFFEKSVSNSGLERGAWARSAFDAFVQTLGFGAGVGSLRGNGLASVLMGSVGWPGTLAFIGFLWAAVGPVHSFRGVEMFGMFSAARVMVLIVLSGQLVSATTPDPTLLLVIFAALAAVLRQHGSASHTVRADFLGTRSHP